MEQEIEYKGIYMKIKMTEDKIILETNQYYHYKRAFKRTGRDTDLLRYMDEFVAQADIR